MALRFMVRMGILLISSSKTIATRSTISGVAALRIEQDLHSKLRPQLWVRLVQKMSDFALVHLASFQGMKVINPIPQFSFLAERLKRYQLAYLHIIESRVNNNVDIECTDSIKFLLDIWQNTSPIFVAGGYTPETAFKAINGEYRDYDVAVIFGRYFLANPDLPYRIKEGRPLNKYDRASFYTPLLPKGYTDYPDIVAGRALSSKGASLGITPE